jgi:hypothetical protein
MRRVVVLVATALFMIAAVPSSVAASAVSSALLRGYHERLMSSSDTDQWAFESGCTGGTSIFDPLYMVGPLTDPATPESTCSVRVGVPVVAVAASFTCWQATLAAARDECESGWNLVEAAVIVDGRSQRLAEDRVSGTFTFPQGALFDEPGLNVVYYGISDATIVHGLKPGVHEISVSFLYEDGFTGATTFHLTVERPTH